MHFPLPIITKEEPLSQQDEGPQNDLNEDLSDAASIGPAIIGWGVAAAVSAILSVTFNSSPLVLGAGWFAKCMAALVGGLLGWLGALAGDAIRKFAHPDAVFTNGGMLSLIWIDVSGFA